MPSYVQSVMNPNLMEQFLGPSTQFFCFNQNEINVVATPIDKKTCLLTKRNVFSTKNSLKNPDIISSSYINNIGSNGLKSLKSSYTKFFDDDELNDSNQTTTESENQLDKTIDLEDDSTENDGKQKKTLADQGRDDE